MKTIKKLEHLKLLFTAGVMVLLFFSCTKEDYTLTRGEVSGIAEPAGVKVIFDRGDKKFSTESDSTGWYVMGGLETGIYKVTFEKKGYVSYKVFGFQFLGGSASLILKGSTLYPEATAKLSIQSVSVSGNQSLTVSGIYDKNEDKGYSEFGGLNWFLSDSPNVTTKNFLQKAYGSLIISDDKFSSQLQVDKRIFGNSKSVYLKGYVKASWDSYYDWEKNAMVYSIGKYASNEMKIDIPEGFFNN